MIQRKQSIYLLLATICFIVSAVLPLGRCINADGLVNTINSIGLVNGVNGEVTYPYFACPMFFLVLCAFQSFGIIFMYKNRKTQAQLCNILVLLVVVGYLICGALIFCSCIDGTESSFRPSIGLGMPIVAAILTMLAHKGIMDDERLIRSVDRIR